MLLFVFSMFEEFVGSKYMMIIILKCEELREYGVMLISIRKDSFF